MPLPEIINWKDLVSGAWKARPILAAAIGVFDGIHLGHRALLSRVVESGLDPAVVTFGTNPKSVLHRASWHGDLLSTGRKLELLFGYGIRKVVLIDFSHDFSVLSGKEFLSFLWENGSIRFLAVGHDFRCGFRLDTDAQAIRSYGETIGFSTEIVDAVQHEGHPVSSSRIRRDVASGRLDHARILLDRPHELDLRIIPHIRDGSRLSFDRKAIRQVLPPLGTYRAVGLGSEDVFRVEVGHDSFVVEYPSEQLAPGIISFVPNV